MSELVASAVALKRERDGQGRAADDGVADVVVTPLDIVAALANGLAVAHRAPVRPIFVRAPRGPVGGLDRDGLARLAWGALVCRRSAAATRATARGPIACSHNLMTVQPTARR